MTLTLQSAARITPAPPEETAVVAPAANAVLAALPFALLVLDDAFYVRRVNAAAEELLGTGERKLLGRALTEILAEETLLQLLQRAQDSRRYVTACDMALHCAGRSVTARVHAAPVAALNAMLLVIDPHDALDAIAAEEMRERITHASGLMAAMIAHEIKNPLAGIRGAAQLLAGETGGESEALARLICREVDRIRAMVERMEALSGVSDMPAEAVNIHEVIRYVMETARMGAAAHVRFREEFDPSLPEAEAPRHALVQVLLNLIINAAEALEGRGNAIITLKTSAGPRHALWVDITDNGPGIAQSVRSTLFEPFTSTRGRGRGLGLAIVARMVTDMKGHIEVLRTAEGEGSTFRIALPAARGQA